MDEKCSFSAFLCDMSTSSKNYLHTRADSDKYFAFILKASAMPLEVILWPLWIDEM